MAKKPATLPRGYRTCTASLAVSDVAAALSFYETAFGAQISAQDSTDAPAFASIKIGNSMMFVTKGWNQFGHMPVALGTGASVAHHMYIDDVDALAEAAVEAGANLISSPEDMFWGERCATLSDPFGHVWTLATRLENLKPEAIEERRMEWLNGTAPAAEAESP